MASPKAWFGAVVARFIFTEAHVVSVRDVGPRMRLAELAGDALKGIDWTPGDKVQVYLAGQGMRTYTPVRWNKVRGETSLLLYVHGKPATTPGAAWAQGLREGDAVSFFGPRGSIRFPELSDPVVFFGDETSFAAACALRDARPSSAIFEVDDEGAARETLDAIGLAKATVVQRRPSDAHLDALTSVVARELSANPAASLALTGKAQTIQLLRKQLKAKGPLREGKTKAYWSVGKAGLD